MNAKSRRKTEMGKRALNFSQAHPDPSPGYAAALARLENRLARAEDLATQQLEGILQVRAATAQKRELRRTMRRTQLAHIVRVAEAAASELPELAQKFVARPEGTPYVVFRTAARSLVAEAQTQKELLVRHGLTDTVLDSLVQSLDEFDQAIEQGSEGRRSHVGASAELEAVTDEIALIVRVMDGLNGFRFVNDAESLAGWKSASNTFPAPSSPSKPTVPPASGEVRPAA